MAGQGVDHPLDGPEFDGADIADEGALAEHGADGHADDGDGLDGDAEDDEPGVGGVLQCGGSCAGGTDLVVHALWVMGEDFEVLAEVLGGESAEGAEADQADGGDGLGHSGGYRRSGLGV